VQWGAKIVSTADPIWDNGGAYVDIMGFDMSGSGNTSIGLHSQGQNDRTIGNRVHDMGSSGCMSGGGIVIGGGATNQSAIANVVYNIGPVPAAVPGCNQIHGLYVSTANCVVQNNITFNIAGKGLHVYGTPSNCVVTYNTSFNNQDGILVGSDNSSAPVSNSVIANNISFANQSYGIYESGAMGSNNQYTNNLLSGNCISPGACNDPSTQVYMITGQLTNTITSNPQFVNYTGTISGNYQLAGSSPAIGAGTSSYTPLPYTDCDGGARPQGSRWDIGAYEYGASPAPWPWM
jgi:parallel beta-helix repeat protein